MDNKPQKIDKKTPAVAGRSEYNNYGSGDQIAHLDTYTGQQFNLIFNISGKTTPAGSDFYSLIVGEDPFESDHVSMEKSRVFTEYIDDDMKSRFLPFSGERESEVRLRPVLLMPECRRADAANRSAAIGAITDIRRSGKDYEIYYQTPLRIGMSTVWQYKDELGIEWDFEFTRTHWTLKQIALLEVLKNARVNLLHNYGKL